MEWKWQISLALEVVEGPNFIFQLSEVWQYDGKTETSLKNLNDMALSLEFLSAS